MSSSIRIIDPRRPAHLPQLDGLRGFGVMLVLIAHLPRPSDSAAAAFVWQAEHVLKLGNVALDAFFLMSGFLITRLLLAERRRTGRISLRQFYWRRTLRIFPVYYLSVLAVTLLWPTDPARTASLVFYVYNLYLPFNPQPYPLEQSWSLAVEEQFYLLWPLLLIVLPPRWLVRTTLVILPVAAVAAAVAFAAAAPPALGGELIYTMLPTRMLPLSLGCFLAVLEQRGRRVDLPIACAAAAIGAVLLVGASAGRAANLVPAGGWFWTLVLPSLSLLSFGFVTALIHPAAPAYLVAPFRWSPARFMGRLSYAIYLVHIPLLFAFGLNDAALAGGPAPLRSSLLIVALSVAAATLSWLLVERPLARLRSSLGDARAPQNAPYSGAR